jgi:hypothetical protein
VFIPQQVLEGNKNRAKKMENTSFPDSASIGYTIFGKTFNFSMERTHFVREGEKHTIMYLPYVKV